MKTSIKRCTVTVAIAVGLTGCAHTEQPPPSVTTGGENLITCERISFKDPLPPLQNPTSWHPKKAERGVVHIRYFVARGQIYAIGFPVVDLSAGTPFFVGPMTDIPAPFSPEKARELCKRSSDWCAFYSGLFHGYGDSRPIPLVCPGPDCPTTPEGPPPGGYGMTVSLGLNPPIVELGPSLDMPRFASLDAQGGANSATDAAALAAENRSPEVEQKLRELFSDTLSRAVCVARVVTPPPAAK